MQSSFKYFIKKNKADIYFYIWVLLTAIDAIYLIASLVLSVINENFLYAWCSILIAFCVHGIFTLILSYLEEKS